MIEWISTSAIAVPPPPPAWVIRQLQLGPGRVSMIHGAKGTTKSIVTWSAAVAAAAGLPVWGSLDVPRALRVAIVDYEMGVGASKRRIHMSALGLGVDLRSLEERLMLASRPDLDLRNADDIARSFDGFDLAIVDTFAGATPNEDENDRRIRGFIDPMSAASDRTGCTFLLTHHEGLKATRSRGSSAIEDACGAVFRLTGSDETKPRRLTQTKVAVDATDPIEPLELLVEKTHDGRGVIVRVKGAPQRDRVDAVAPIVLQHLRAWDGDKPPTTNELFDRVRGNRNDFIACVKRLAEGASGMPPAISINLDGQAKRIRLTDGANGAERGAAE